MVLEQIFRLYDSRRPESYEVKDSSRGESDFCQTVMASWGDIKRVIKITCNAFTTPHRVEGWGKIISAYRSIGCYCPQIIPSLAGNSSELVEYNGYSCLVYAEEYSIYQTAAQFGQERIWKNGRRVYQEDAFRLTAAVGALRWAHVNFPSAYCIFERFDPSEVDDEVMECALGVKMIIEQDLPGQMPRFQRIWESFLENKAALARIYGRLPTSVFQADLGEDNVLLDENLRFTGLLDFNLSGRETVLNMMFRDALVNFEDDEKNMLYVDELQEKAFSIFLENLLTIKRFYIYTKSEIEAAPLLYRYLRPFWWYTVRALERDKKDSRKVARILAWIETEQQRNINFQTVLSKS